MDFDLSEEQQMIAQTVRSFVESELYPLEDQAAKTGVVPLTMGQGPERSSMALTVFLRQASAIPGRKISQLLAGYRGAPAGATMALEQLVASVVLDVADTATRLKEVALNPVVVLPEDDGVIAVDAFIRIKELTACPTRS